MCVCCSLALSHSSCLSSPVVLHGQKGTGLDCFFGVLELLAAFLSSTGWMEALRISGKSDWLQLGYQTAPLVAEVFLLMFAVGIGCIAANIVGLFREEEENGETA